MDRHTLENKIMRMERELLALKTACERGLGAYKFYTKIINFSNVDYRRWTASVLVGEPDSPLVQAVAFGVDSSLLYDTEAYLRNEREVVVSLNVGRGDVASGYIVVTSSSMLGDFS